MHHKGFQNATLFGEFFKEDLERKVDKISLAELEESQIVQKGRRCDGESERNPENG